MSKPRFILVANHPSSIAAIAAALTTAEPASDERSILGYYSAHFKPHGGARPMRMGPYRPTFLPEADARTFPSVEAAFPFCGT